MFQSVDVLFTLGVSNSFHRRKNRKYSMLLNSLHSAIKKEVIINIMKDENLYKTFEYLNEKYDLNNEINEKTVGTSTIDMSPNHWRTKKYNRMKEILMIKESFILKGEEAYNFMNKVGYNSNYYQHFDEQTMIPKESHEHYIVNYVETLQDGQQINHIIRVHTFDLGKIGTKIFETPSDKRSKNNELFMHRLADLFYYNSYMVTSKIPIKDDLTSEFKIVLNDEYNATIGSVYFENVRTVTINLVPVTA